MTSSSPAVRLPDPLLPRALHFLLSLGLAVTMVFLIILGVSSVSASLRAIFFGVFSARFPGFDPSLNTINTLYSLIPWAVVVGLIVPFLIAWRLKLRSWRLLLILPMEAALLAMWWFLVPFLGDELVFWRLFVTSVNRTFVLTVLLIPLLLAWRLQKRSWWWVVGGYLAVAPALTYLVVDDATLRHPTTLEEIAPAFPGAEKSYEVLMRYGKNHPLGRAFRGPDRIWKVGPPFPPPAADLKNAKEWRAWLLARRAEIEADWADLGFLLAWWSELNTFDRIGDLMAAPPNAEIITFQPFRTYSRLAIAIAGLQALDGQGDAAFETLLPLLEVSRKLEPSARTLVRFMIARTTQRQAIDAAGFVLDHATVSPATRARFTAALMGGSGGEAAARRLMAIEYSIEFDVLRGLNFWDWTQTEEFVADDSVRHGPDYFGQPVVKKILSSLSPLVFNPNKTLNLYGDFTERLQELAARREPEKIDPMAIAFFRNEARPRFKNLGGSVLITSAIPAGYSSMLKSYWAIEDARSALRERLSKM